MTENRRTNGKWKIGQCSVGPETAIHKFPNQNQDLQYYDKVPPLILVSEEYLVSLDGEDGDTDGDIEPPRELRPEAC